MTNDRLVQALLIFQRYGDKDTHVSSEQGGLLCFSTVMPAYIDPTDRLKLEDLNVIWEGYGWVVKL